ncbi:unnamed protein product, partial [Allacma fusca]
EYLLIIHKIATTKGDLENIRVVPPDAKVKPISIHRPALELPKFSGERDEWSSFYAIFKSAIEDDTSLTDAERLQYLVRCLSGPPKDSVKNFPIIDASFVPAMKLLKTNYSNKRLIVHDNLEKILSLPQMSSESAPALQKMLDQTYQGLSVLKNEGQPTDQWGTIVTHILIKKLDPKSRELFESQQSATEVPVYNDLIQFLTKRVGSLRMLTSTVPKHTKSNEKFSGKHKSVASNLSVSSSSCTLCEGEEHNLWKCPKFIAMNISEKRSLVQSRHLCFNCLRPGHGVASCESSDCRKCHKKHHTLLHSDNQKSAPSPQEGPKEVSPEASVATLYSNVKGGQVLLQTAIVKVQDRFGQHHLIRALLDNGSQATLISEDCIRRIKMPRSHANVQVTGVGSTQCSSSRGIAHLTLGSHFDPAFEIKVSALILSSVTGFLPPKSCAP